MNLPTIPEHFCHKTNFHQNHNGAVVLSMLCVENSILLNFGDSTRDAHILITKNCKNATTMINGNNSIFDKVKKQQH